MTAWDSFFSRAAAWEVEPVVMSNLRTHFSDSIPVFVSAQAAAREQEARSIALTRTLVLVDLANRFAGRGIDVIVLKGPAVAIDAYGDASFRTFSDIDLLVRKHDLSLARDLILELGYARDYSPASEPRLVSDQHALEFSRGNVKIELHWRLLSKHLRFDFGDDQLWDTSRKLSCAGAELQVLGVAELFVFLCAHGAKHEWERVRWICDIAQLAERLNGDQAEQVAAIAKRANAKRILELGLRVARDVMGDIGGALAGQVSADDSEAARLAAQASRRLGLSDAETRPDWTTRLDFRLRPLIFWARSRERRRDQIATLARVFLVPTENDAAAGPIAWIGRPARLARRAFRNVLASMTAPPK